MALDEAERRHVYLDGGDLVFRQRGDPCRAGLYRPVDVAIEGAGFLASRASSTSTAIPSPEPASKGLLEESSGDKLGQGSLYEYLPVFGPSIPRCRRPSTMVAMSELPEERRHRDVRSVDEPRWLGRRSRGDRHPRRVCPMMRQGYWYTRNGHTVEYAWDEKAGETAFAAAIKAMG